MSKTSNPTDKQTNIEKTARSPRSHQMTTVTGLIKWFQKISVKHTRIFFPFSILMFFSLQILLHISHSLLLVTLTTSSYILKMFYIFHVIFWPIMILPYAQVKRNEVNVYNVKKNVDVPQISHPKLVEFWWRIVPEATDDACFVKW